MENRKILEQKLLMASMNMDVKDTVVSLIHVHGKCAEHLFFVAMSNV
jgi:hypothetical protein